MHLRTLYRWGFQGEPVLASVIAVERHFELAFDYVWVGDKGADPFPVSKKRARAHQLSQQSTLTAL